MKLLRDRRGATAIEYGLLAALIACAMVGAAASAGGAFSNVLTTISTKLPNG